MRKLEQRENSFLKALFAAVPSLRRASNSALSVYLPVRAEGYDLRFYDIELGQLKRRYKDRLDDDEREVMERELRRIREHLEIVKPAGCPAMAGFADGPVGVLALIKLPAGTDPRLRVGPLLLVPIERQLERFPPALVAVVNKEQGRLFAAILDGIYPIGQVKGVEVKH